MINNVTLMGRLTYDTEIKSTPQGVAVLRFQIAVDRSYQAKGQERQADFIDCVAWRNTAEFISKYFHKGDLIALTGEIQTSNYTDKDGNKRKQVEVNVNQASFCGAKQDSKKANIDVDVNNADFEEFGEDLPF